VTTGRRLGKHLMQIDRRLELNHSSRIEEVEAALTALNRAIRISVKKAA